MIPSGPKDKLRNLRSFGPFQDENPVYPFWAMLDRLQQRIQTGDLFQWLILYFLRLLKTDSFLEISRSWPMCHEAWLLG